MLSCGLKMRSEELRRRDCMERKDAINGLQYAIGVAHECGCDLVKLSMDNAEALLNILRPSRESVKKVPCVCGNKRLETWTGWVDGKVAESFKFPKCGIKTGLYKTHRELVDAWNEMISEMRI